MPRSGYVAEIRRQVGDQLLVLPSVSICIFDGDGRILLVRHDNFNVWATPGGTVEPDEAPAQAAIQLGGLAVDPGFHGRGIGSRLLETAEAWARKRGCVGLWIRSGSRRTQAHEFYRTQGYRDLKRQVVPAAEAERLVHRVRSLS